MCYDWFARRGLARPGKARRGEVWRGKARRGKGKNADWRCWSAFTHATLNPPTPPQQVNADAQ